MYANTAPTYFMFDDPGKSIALFENLVHTQLIVDPFGRMNIVLSYLHRNDAVSIIYDKGQEQTADKDYSCLVQSFTSYLRPHEFMKGGYVE